MSSDFHLICASHNPAIVLDEYASLGAFTEDLAAASRNHPHCDLLVGRWSGALIEIGCLPSSAGPAPRTSHCNWHRDVHWIAACWLRLMLLDAGEHHAEARLPDCWPLARVQSLRGLLDLEAAP